MSLRQKILFGIIAVYSLTLGILAVLLSIDVAARERADQLRQQKNLEDAYRNTVALVRLSFGGRLEQYRGYREEEEKREEPVASPGREQLEIRELLGWEIWDELYDPVLLARPANPEERFEEIFINPSGARAPDRPVESDRIRRMMEQAIAEGQTVRDRDRVAIALGGYCVAWGLPVPELPFQPFVNVRMVFILIVIGLPLITVVTYGLLTRVVIRPIERLQQANRRVAGGDYSAELPAREGGRPDEIDGLIESFNAMLRDVRDYHENLEERVREATDRIRHTERRLVTAQRLAATGKLAAGIAHEINNPLGGMMNISRNLIQKSEEYDDERRREYLELILDGLERIQSTVRKMMPLSIREVKPQVVDLTKVFRQVRELIRYRTDDTGIRLVEDLEPVELPVFGDPHELHQVYLNILINALDAIEARREKEEGEGEGQIVVRARRAGAWIETAVEDDGTGMSDEQIQQAFDLFFTTKDAGEGTGLGLSIVHNLVENHGGTVGLRARPGGGIVVEIRLPVASR